jgi:hypothetical protein
MSWGWVLSGAGRGRGCVRVRDDATIWQRGMAQRTWRGELHAATGLRVSKQRARRQAAAAHGKGEERRREAATAETDRREERQPRACRSA